MSSREKAAAAEVIRHFAARAELLGIEMCAAAAGDRDTAAEAGKLISWYESMQRDAEKIIADGGYTMEDFIIPDPYLQEEAAAARKRALSRLVSFANSGSGIKPEVLDDIQRRISYANRDLTHYMEKRIEQKISSYPTRAIKIKQTAAA